MKNDTPEAPTVRRLAHLDGLRALAAIYVMVHHMVNTVFPFDREGANGPLQPFTRGMDLVFGMAHYAVTAFIVISGYSLALGLRSGRFKRGAARWLAARTCRIVLPYWAALVLSSLSVATIIGKPTGTSNDNNLPLDAVGTLVHALLLQDVLPGNSANGAFWTISIEWHIYFLMPLLLLCFRRKGPAYAAVLWLVAAYVAYVVLFGTQLAGTTPQYYALFALGALAHLAFEGEPHAIQKIRRLSAYAVPGSALLAAAFIVSPLGRAQQNTYVDLFVGVTLALGLAAMGRGDLPRLRVLLSWRPLTFVGVFAFSIYLMHGPLLQIAWQLMVQPFGLGTDAGLIVLLTGGTAFIGAFSYVFYRFFEAPAHRLSQRVGRGEQVRKRAVGVPDTTPILPIVVLPAQQSASSEKSEGPGARTS